MLHAATVVRVRLCLLAVSATLFGGCAAIGGFAGAAASLATSAATSNAAIALSVGIGVKTATDEASRYVARRLQRSEQEAIAAVVSDMKPGDTAGWQLAHLIGSGSDRGEVRVTRVIATPLALCQEVLFSVPRSGEAETRHAWFTTTLCRDGKLWKWAAAEPAVERWGNLQ